MHTGRRFTFRRVRDRASDLLASEKMWKSPADHLSLPGKIGKNLVHEKTPPKFVRHVKPDLSSGNEMKISIANGLRAFMVVPTSD